MESTELLTVRAAADYLKVATGTLYNWRHAGTGPPAVTVGVRSVRYRRSDLDAWIDEQSERVI